MIRIIDHEGNGYGAQAEITRKKGVNGEKSLTGTIYTNDEVLNGVDRGWKLEFENELYAFIFALPKDTGDIIELEFDAVHEFFYDMSKSSQNNLLNDGSHTFKTYLDFIFNGTGYNYRLDVDVKAFEKQNFGQKNRLELFYDVVNTVGVEFSVNGSVVRILERVGNDLSTVVKKGFNLNELRLEKNIGDFVTYQKGFGAWNDEEDHSKGRLEVEYLSPLAEVYGKLDADPIVDERYTVKSNLLARLKSNVEGSYQISVQIDMEDLTRAGYEYKQPHEGDSIMAINEDLGFQRKVRIVSYETDFDTEGNILDHRITCNSLGIVEESILSNNSIKNSIKELQTDLEITRKQVIEFNVSADGKSTNYYGPIEPSPDEYKLRIGDTWFDTSGEDTIVKVWNGVEWRKSGADVDAIRREIEQAQQDIADTKENVNNRLDDLDDELEGKFTGLDETISQVDKIANQAQINAGIAIDNALEAMSQASIAVENTGNLSVRVDDVENTLSVKADKQTVDDLTGVVDLQALDIKANADGLALKANQDTVDTLAGTVQSLGTEFDIVAGQVSSKVWMSDIDDIEIGGRNYATKNSYHPGKTLYGSGVGGTGSLSNNNDRISYEVIVEPDTDYNLTIHGEGYFHRLGEFSLSSDEFIVDYNRYNSELKTMTLKTSLSTERLIISIHNNGKGFPIPFEDALFKLEKGTIATDWTPAPEDTDAKISYIETEFTQKYDSITGTVSSLDGRVAQQAITLDSITNTVADHTGRIATTELNINGLQTTVAGKADQSQVTQLDNLYNIAIGRLNDLGNPNLIVFSDLENGTFNASDGSPTITSRSNRLRTMNFIEREVNEDFVFSLQGTTFGIQINIYQYDADKNYISNVGFKDFENNEMSYIPNPDTRYFKLLIRFKNGQDINASHITQAKLKLESGSQVTDYDTSYTQQAQISVLSDNINLRVEKGDVLGQINIEAGATLIQNEKLYLDAETVAFSGQAFIPGAVIEDLSVDGAKIADASINSAKIAELDAGKITFGELRGIAAYIDYGEISGWTIQGNTMHKQHSDTGLFSLFKSGGDVMLAAGSPQWTHSTDAKLQIWHDGTIRFGTGATRIEETALKNLRLTSHNRILLRANATVETDSRIIPTTNNSLNLGESNQRWANVYGTSLRVGSQAAFQPATNTSGSAEIYSNYSLFLKPEDHVIAHSTSVRPRYTNSTHLGMAAYRWDGVYVNSVGVNQSSDIRLKNNVRTIKDSLLDYIGELKPIEYEGENGETSFGYSAQDYLGVLSKYAYKELGMRSSEVLSTFNSINKADSYLGINYKEIEVLKGAYRDKRINDNTGKIVHIEDEVTQLKNRIKQLEARLNAS